jgi:prophage regulatory protein
MERHIMANPNATPPIGTLPATGFIRQAQLIPHIVPVSSATWWRWCRSGKAPKPVKLSSHITAWRTEEIRAFLDAQASGETSCADIVGARHE